MKPSAKFNLDIANILGKSPTLPLLKTVDYEFAILNGLIRKIKIQKIEGGREVIMSDIENYQLEKQVEHIQAALKKVSDALGAGEDVSAVQYKLNSKQRDLAITTLEQLQSLATEMMMYGTMANAVSWNKIRDLKRLNMEQQQMQNDVQKALSSMRGASVPGAR